MTVAVTGAVQARFNAADLAKAGEGLAAVKALLAG